MELDMNPFELLKPDGQPAGVFCCGKCRTVLAKDLADKCCQLCECGAESWNRFQAECETCSRKRQADHMCERLEKATEIEWDGEMMLLSEDIPSGCRDGWFDNPEHVLDSIEEARQDDLSFRPPQFVFASTKRVKGLDLDRAIEDMMDDTHEEPPWPSESSVETLQKHVDEFNASESITYFEPDYSRKVRISEDG